LRKYRREPRDGTGRTENGNTDSDSSDRGGQRYLDHGRQLQQIEINGEQISIVMKGEDTDTIDSNADLIITGGTVIIDGKEVQNIPNQSIHRMDS